MRKDADEQEKKWELEAVGEMATTLQNIFIAHNTKVCRSDTICAQKATFHCTLLGTSTAMTHNFLYISTDMPRLRFRTIFMFGV